MRKPLLLGATLVWCSSLLLGCLSAARRSSGVIGCNPDEIKIANESIGALGDHTWTATCQGRTYYCSMNTAQYGSPNVSCKEGKSGKNDDQATTASGSQPVAPARSQPPTGAAGFTFGASAEEAARTCVEAGGEWQEGQPDASCSRPARPVGFDGQVFASLCQGKVCRIRVVAQKPDQEVAVLKRTFIQLTDMLRKKYGCPLARIPPKA